MNQIFIIYILPSSDHVRADDRYDVCLFALLFLFERTSSWRPLDIAEALSPIPLRRHSDTVSVAIPRVASMMMLISSPTFTVLDSITGFNKATRKHKTSNHDLEVSISTSLKQLLMGKMSATLSCPFSFPSINEW